MQETNITKRFLALFLFALLFGLNLNAQEFTEVTGRITDERNQPLGLVNIAIVGLPGGTMTKDDGTFILKAPTNRDLELSISSIGYATQSVKLNLPGGKRYELNRKLQTVATELPDFVVEDRQIRSANLTTIDPRLAGMIPSASGGIEALLKTMPGVSSNSELTSQYSVRGGNYDENLVYVNDVEIYRPFLIRSGEQEGLSFLNSDMVSSILFSAGGFEARYGDKLSSVLDIRYKRPTKTQGSVSASLLGASMHLEGSSKDRKLMYLMGFRQKSNQYILRGLETKGDYKPSFTDLQGMVLYEVNSKLEFSFLGNYARNSYSLIPDVKTTNFGTINEALQLKVYFEGEEVDRFNNYMGAFTSTFRPRKDLSLKMIVSAFQTNESETFDIMGQYWIAELETDQGSDNFGQAVNQAVDKSEIGTYLNHARNYLHATVFNVEHRGIHERDRKTFQWGVKYQRELIDDRLNEWNMNDSAGYTLPYYGGFPGMPGNQSNQPDIILQDVVRTHVTLNSNRISGFAQFNDVKDIGMGQFGYNLGVRANYWDLNKQLVVSPRGGVSLKPSWETDILFRLTAGVYHQPPFYRELRARDGSINKSVKAQTSYHIVAASDLNFMAWGRPFKFIGEAYYKYLTNLVPYDVDNVRIRYFADNMAKGYATGIDFKINGEFVNGIESWASLSLMQTREDIDGDSYTDYYNSEGKRIIAGFTANHVAVDSVTTEIGFMARPTDQLMTFGLFFQDYLPSNPTFKMHLNLLFGTGIPFSPPGEARVRNSQRMPPFRRVDIGLSKQIIGGVSNGKNQGEKPALWRKYINNIWISAEVLNLLQVKNTISYSWVKDVNNRQYGVPNYLTPRQLNIKISVEF